MFVLPALVECHFLVTTAFTVIAIAERH